MGENVRTPRENNRNRIIHCYHDTCQLKYHLKPRRYDNDKDHIEFHKVCSGRGCDHCNQCKFINKFISKYGT